MKILFDHPNPFLLAHGGFQTQIEQTKRGLEEAGVTVEPVRWWDASQTGDVIHYFGRPPEWYIEQCHGKRIRVVTAELLGAWGTRSVLQRNLQTAMMRVGERVVPPSLLYRLAWGSYKITDAAIVGTTFEAGILQRVFRAPPEKIHVVQNGVEEVFFRSAVVPRGRWLVCTATITERKRALELAEAAITAQTPVWIVGKPYSDSDPYGQRFVRLASENKEWVRYDGAVSDRQELANIYRQARGFVLLSEIETLSLSAFEAAACDCPLLLSDLPWARSTFFDSAKYGPVACADSATATALKRFYEEAPNIRPTFRPPRWVDIGRQLKGIYEGLLSTSW